jgi:hypothetical protein
MSWDGYPNRKWLGYPPGFWIGMTGYVVTILLIGRFLKNAPMEPDSRLLLGVVPLLPLLVMGRGLLRMIRQQDELYIRIQFEAVAYAAGIVIVLSFMVGFLEEFQVIPHINSMWAGQVLVFAWGIAAGILNRRYR